MATRTTAILAIPSALLGLVVLAPAAHASGPSYANCTALHKTYPHGVGRSTAHDKVRGATKPVTTWVHDTKAYNAAMRAKPDLDRDKDGVACEKR